LKGYQAVIDLFFGNRSNQDDGLVEKMLDVLQSTEEALKELLGTTGTFVDKLA
jgi:hypothetical protein